MNIYFKTMSHDINATCEHLKNKLVLMGIKQEGIFWAFYEFVNFTNHICCAIYETYDSRISRDEG